MLFVHENMENVLLGYNGPDAQILQVEEEKINLRSMLGSSSSI
jgi:hypothetical protein